VKWSPFERRFSNQKSAIRYIREIIYGKKRAVTNLEITTDSETMPENSTTFVMRNLQGKLKKTLGDLYGLRIWLPLLLSKNRRVGNYFLCLHWGLV
jgi:SRSO17 transposase